MFHKSYILPCFVPYKEHFGDIFVLITDHYWYQIGTHLSSLFVKKLDIFGSFYSRVNKSINLMAKTPLCSPLRNTYFSQQLLTVTSAFNRPFVTTSLAASSINDLIAFSQCGIYSSLHIVSI
jgi:hypothetical protein